MLVVDCNIEVSYGLADVVNNIGTAHYQALSTSVPQFFAICLNIVLMTRLTMYYLTLSRHI